MKQANFWQKKQKKKILKKPFLTGAAINTTAGREKLPKARGQED